MCARRRGSARRPARAAGGAGAREPRLDATPNLRRRRDRRGLIGEAHKPRLPERHLGGESRLALDAQLGSAALRGGKHAEDIFRGGKIAVLARAYGVVVVHRSRHARSFMSPRLIQLFMVPSGTSDLRASSS